MSGLHKLSELDQHFTPESWERIAGLEAEVDATMPPDESCPVAPMRTLREMADPPLAELATALQTDADGVLAFEECDDPTVSQLRAYITAIGARVKIVAEFPDGDEVILANFYQKRRWPAPPAKKAGDYYDKVGKPLPPIPEGPTAYRQIEWAAKTYRAREYGRRFDAAYREVYTDEFRQALLYRCSKSDINRLLVFLNKWLSRLPYAKMTPVLQESVPEAIAELRGLATAPPAPKGLDDWDSTLVQRAVDRLTADRGVGATVASKILGVVNPELFVIWDKAIQRANFPRHQPDSCGAGARYVRFLWDMENAAQSIRQDALDRHEIADPAGRLSKTLGLNPPYPIAKFIDEYNFLTITKGEQYHPPAEQE